MKEYEVQGNYGYGYEAVFTASDRTEGLAILKDYRANEPGTAFRLVSKVVA